MSYYQGDYYRGGFFSSLGGLFKKAAGFIPGVGPIIQKLGGGASAMAKLPMIQSAGRVATSVYGRGAAMARIASKHPVLSAAAAAGALGTGAAMLHHRGGVAALPGAAGGFGRRRKRINVCNPRALRRAIRRTHGFAKLAMKTIHLVHPKKHARFGGFKKGRKK